MKKRFLIISLLLAVCLAFSVVSFGCNPNTSQEESREVSIVRDWIDSMRSSINKKDSKGYETSFKQSYTLEYQGDNEFQTVELSENYEASGWVKFSYSIKDLEENDEIDYSDIFTDGTGYFAGSQNERMDLNYKVYSKYLVENKEREDKFDYEYNHDFTIAFDNDDIYTYAKNKVTDKLDAENNVNDVFKGKIAKEHFGEFSTPFMASFSKEILYLDAWSYISEFSELINTFYENVRFADTTAVEKFINDYNIKIVETDDVVMVGYTIDTNYVITTATGEERTNYPPIVGMSMMEKSTGNIIYYRYNFTDVFSAMMNVPKDEEGEFSVNVGEFIVEGKILNSELEELHLDGDYIEYTSETKDEFIENFEKYVSFSPDILELE